MLGEYENNFRKTKKNPPVSRRHRVRLCSWEANVSTGDANEVHTNNLPSHDGRNHADRFAEALYPVLHAIASTYCQPGVSGTLQPTVIVHEAYLKLATFAAQPPKPGAEGTDAVWWKDREHFLAVAATAMRQVLVDYARRRKALKRAGEFSAERADVDLLVSEPSLGRGGRSMIDVAELDDALRCLENADPRAAKVVVLRFFGGLTVDETARVMGLGRTTVEESWRTARAWLLTQLDHDHLAG